ncbi:MAG: hydrolase [Hyphomonadaceae bacterium]|nr:hydrolase [Hyphomonadaceae bacterium]
MSPAPIVSSASPDWASAAAPALSRLDAAAELIVQRTEAWSAINSGSLEREGLARMCDALCAAFAALPGVLELLPLAPTERIGADGLARTIEHGVAIRVRVRPEAPVCIALTGHYDTVFPAAHAFQHPWREGSRLRGPGVADMKGGLTVMLAAREAIEATPGANGVGYEILLSPDEEIGSPATASLLADLGARAALGMTYEPAMADGALAGERKGSANYSLVLKGRAAHVGRAFADGRSAVIAAAEAALSLDKLNGAREAVTFNTGAIDGGGPSNVVPDSAVLRFNVRAPDAASAAWAEGQVSAIVAAAAARDGISAHLHGGFTRPPKPLTPAQLSMMGWTQSAAAMLGVDIQFKSSGGVCEGNNLAAAGCPNIDTLGPCGGELHSDGEFAIISSFAERAKLSLLLLAGVAQGAFDAKGLRT